MREWLEGIAGPTYATAMLWTLAALLGLLVLLVLIKIVRSLTFGTFVSGGRGRKTRLAVMDAAAVDSQRRLVLVRRDDVEHLILIGGPTDVVVEQNIRLVAPSRRPADESRDVLAEERRPRQAEPTVALPEPARPVAPALRQAVLPTPPAARPSGETTLQVDNPQTSRPPPQPAANPPVIPAAAPPAPAVAAGPAAAPRPAPAISVDQPAPPRPAPSPSPAPSPTPRPVAAPSAAGSRFADFAARLSPNKPTTPPPAAAAAVPPSAAPVAYAVPRAAPPPHVPAPANQTSANDLDEALLAELDATLDASPLDQGPDLPASVEDEMSKLLGQLSRPPRS